ncbi:MarR family winged helix-turn-helix transcriptional regulator [Periweissella cryptocerci]|nr:MarR family transcriptional regulator [Periweissella cryptocerci]
MTVENLFDNLMNLVHNPNLLMASRTIGLRDNARVDNSKRLLRILVETDKAMTSGSIAEILGIRPASVSVLVSKSESNGYVERIKDENDARVVLVKITAAGREFLETQVDTAAEVKAAIFAPLNEEERASFEASLEKVNAHVASDEFTQQLMDKFDMPEFAKRAFTMKHRNEMERFGNNVDQFDKHMEQWNNHFSKHMDRVSKHLDKHMKRNGFGSDQQDDFTTRDTFNQSEENFAGRSFDPMDGEKFAGRGNNFTRDFNEMGHNGFMNNRENPFDGRKY